MNILVLGATGKTGREFVRLALQNGHKVVALVRTPQKLTRLVTEFGGEDGPLQVHSADITNREQLELYIKGVDAVVKLLGHGAKTPAGFQAAVTKQLIPAMLNNSVSRLVTLTGTGVRFPQDSPHILDKILNTTLKVIMKARIADGREFCELIRQSSLDWTIVRTLLLTNSPATNNYVVSTNLSRGLTKPISRADVARFVLQLVQEGTFIKQAPVIGGC